MDQDHFASEPKGPLSEDLLHDELHSSGGEGGDPNGESIKIWVQKMDELIFAVPPDFTFCETHLAASRVGYFTKENAANQFLCGCCKEPVLKEPFTLGCNVKDFLHYGPCYPFYFLFMKFIIINLVLLASSVTLPMILMFMAVEAPSGAFSLRNIINSFQLFVKDHQTMNFLLNIGFVVLELCYLAFFACGVKKFFSKIQRIYEDDSRRSLVIEGLPKETSNEELAKGIGVPMPSVEKVVWVPDLSSYSRARKHFMDLNNRKIKLLLKSEIFKTMQMEKKCCKLREVDEAFQMEGYSRIGSSNLKESLTGITLEIECCQSELREIRRKYKKNPSAQSVGTAFLIFKTHRDMQEVFGNLRGKKERELKLRVSMAMAPADIIWESFKPEKFRNLVYGVIGYNSMVILGCLSLIIHLYFSSVSSLRNRKLLCGCVLLFCTLMINGLVSIVGSFTTNSSQFRTNSEKKNAMFARYLFGTVLNMAIAPYISINLIAAEKTQTLFQMYSIFLALLVGWLTLISHFKDFVGITSFKKLYYLFKIKRGQINSILMPQCMVNKYYEKIEFSITERYVTLIVTFITIVILQSTFPIGSVVSLAFLLLSYWTDKFVFIRWSRKPDYVDQTLTRNSFVAFITTHVSLILLRTVAFLLSTNSVPLWKFTSGFWLASCSTGLVCLVMGLVCFRIFRELSLQRQGDQKGGSIVRELAKEKRAKDALLLKSILKKTKLGLSYEDYNPLQVNSRSKTKMTFLTRQMSIANTIGLRTPDPEGSFKGYNVSEKIPEVSFFISNQEEPGPREIPQN